jgi:hypothetical protein
MTTQLSYTKVEKKILPKFRKKMNLAESTEDVKKFFSYAMQDLLSQVFTEKYKPSFDDVRLQIDQSQPFFLNDTVRQLEDYALIWNNSDLSVIMSRFANIAAHRYNHLEKKPEKTESKIRM